MNMSVDYIFIKLLWVNFFVELDLHNYRLKCLLIPIMGSGQL